MEEKWFGGFEVSIYGSNNSLDLQEIEREDGLYDIVICNHVLEHVENDRQAFREILRILKPAGFLQFSVPSPTQYTKTKDWATLNRKCTIIIACTVVTCCSDLARHNPAPIFCKSRRLMQ